MVARELTSGVSASRAVLTEGTCYMELMPDIHLVDGVTSNAYLIVEPDGLTLVDTGLPGSARKILAYLRSIGKVPSQLHTIVLTHQHVDHVGGAAELAALSGAEVIAHPVDTPAIEGTAARDVPSGPLSLVFRTVLLPRLRPVKVSRQVTAGDTLPILADDGGLQVIETPGHTRGEIALYLPGRRLLFAGDTYRHTAQGEITIPFKMFNYDTPRALASLAALREYAIDSSLPGHGKPIVRDAAAPLGRATTAAGESQAPVRQ
jgi:glyoxylase-like metal-dependent hydrolase (beta-lactamase superfamily II)